MLYPGVADPRILKMQFLERVELLQMLQVSVSYVGSIEDDSYDWSPVDPFIADGPPPSF